MKYTQEQNLSIPKTMPINKKSIKINSNKRNQQSSQSTSSHNSIKKKASDNHKQNFEISV